MGEETKKIKLKTGIHSPLDKQFTFAGKEDRNTFINCGARQKEGIKAFFCQLAIFHVQKMKAQTLKFFYFNSCLPLTELLHLDTKIGYVYY